MTIPLYVVIPVKNQLHYTQGIVKQLLEQGEADRIFVLDNGSTDGTRDWVSDLYRYNDERFKVTLMEADGKSIHQMWNLGLDCSIKTVFRSSSGKVMYSPHSVAILNNDIRIGPNFLSSLNKALRCDPSVGVVGANYDNRRFILPTQEVHQICANRYDGTGGLPGFAFMVKGEDGYRFPEDLTWWCGDNDLLLTVLSQGRKALLVRDAVCEHLDGGGGTGKWDDPEIQPVLQRDIETFRRKWANRSSSA